MKKLSFILLVMLALVGLKANAAMYIVGNAPFGDWNPDAGVEMTLGNDGLYTYRATINGTVYFVFANGLDGNWDTFNANYRYGPTNGNETVTVGNWVDTQQAGDHGSYKFEGTGDEYLITFDEDYQRFKIEGYVAPIVITTYTVVGPESVFGTNWNAADENNDMTLVNGIYTWTKSNVTLYKGTLEYKIVGNHDWGHEWPQGMFNFQEEIFSNGIYTITITFNPETEEPLVELERTGDIPMQNTVYVFGDVENQGWDPTQGVELTYDETTGIYSGVVHPTLRDGEALCYFGFTHMLADPESETPWEDIEPYRFGPGDYSVDNYYAHSYNIGQWDILTATEFGYASIAIPEGTWTISVRINNDTYLGYYGEFRIDGEWPYYEGNVYVMGEVNGNVWAPNQGAFMSSTGDQSLTFLINIHTEGENEGYSYFNFSKELATSDVENGGWEEIATSRFGAFTEDNSALLIDEEKLGQELQMRYSADPASFQLPAGQWILELSVDNMTLIVTDARGDVNRDGRINVSDVTALITYVLTKAEAPAEADCNKDTVISIADVTTLINYVLAGNWPAE